jgi:hypothetical protein
VKDGIDQAHEQVADAGTVLCLEEQCILAMQDGLLQRAFSDIVIQRGACLTQEQGQLVPVLEHVADGPPRTEFRLGQLLLQLPRQPSVQLLMKLQTRLG